MPLIWIEDTPDKVELSFDIKDAWELGVCTCCANSYLLRLGDGQFLYMDSWRLTPFALTESFPTRAIRLTVNPNTNVVLSVHTDGSLISKRPELLDRAFESELSGREYRLVAYDDLPMAWRRVIDGA